MSSDPALTAPEVPGYDVGERVGSGGSGTVWAATRVSDGAPVAVKVVAVGAGDEADSLAREFAVLARVDVEGLVGFHEAVGLAGEPAAVALVLDQVGGGSLEGIVRARGHLSVGESVTMLAPVARALAGLHDLGVVHGDVHPGNVLLERTGRPLLADLGVASLAGDVAGQLYGTEGFVAPEVLDRGVVTTASDVYAVGALAWWCVTGSAPAPVALRRPLEELAPGLPNAWSEVTRRALLGDPDARPTAAELALAYYDSAPCEPLRLVVGRDETSLLTQRLRQPEATNLSPPAAPRRTAVAVLRDGARRVVAPMVALTTGRDPRRAAALGTVVVLVVGLAVGGLMAAGRVTTPDWVHPSRDAAGRQDASRAPVLPVFAPGTAAAPTTTSATPEPVASRSDPATDQAAPQRDPRGLMVALSTLRAEVMTSGSLPDLARLDAPGSEALAQDTALLKDLEASGQSWQGVALTVTSARTVKHSATSATLDAVVQTAAYLVVDGSGRALPRPAVMGDEMRFSLDWSAGRWRVASITRATR
ncbi:MAG: serine/threonine-protein kinase [Pedococcus sp.]